ncbi:hypothetical protein ES703_88192 [subsurface metagenome]
MAGAVISVGNYQIAVCDNRPAGHLDSAVTMSSAFYAPGYVDGRGLATDIKFSYLSATDLTGDVQLTSHIQYRTAGYRQLTKGAAIKGNTEVSGIGSVPTNDRPDEGRKRFYVGSVAAGGHCSGIPVLVNIPAVGSCGVIALPVCISQETISQAHH